MHEYSIVQSLVDSVEKAVWGPASAGPVSAKAGTHTVHRIHVRIGEVSGVDAGLLATAYEVFRAGTRCEWADMVIERVPARWECPRCAIVIAAGRALRCPACHGPARLAAGDEIVLQRIELEVP
jgi:hydrogenase nickel incorporation protein HypA/HybF